MPGPDRSLTLGQARDHVLKRCFAPCGADLIGLQTEWLVTRGDDLTSRVPFARVQTATTSAHPLPAASLVATFASSPLSVGRATGWKSARLATWWQIDPTRTAPVALGGGVAAWASYALDARVMFIRESIDRYIPLDSPLTFTQWILDGH